MSSAGYTALPDLLTAAELRERWHIGRTTLWEWCKRGVPGTSLTLAPLKLGRSLRFRRSIVEDVEALWGRAADPRRPIRRRRRSAA